MAGVAEIFQVIMQAVSQWLTFAGGRMDELLLRIGEHVALVSVAIGMAVLIGVPLGIFASRVKSLSTVTIVGVGILQTIPSLAMLALLFSLTGHIGKLPAAIALTLYALLPIARNTLTGLRGVPDSIIEAARGVGMRPNQRLVKVELPLALPVIVAGIRTAAVIGVGIATLSTYIGAGGLGVFIKRGLNLNSRNLILLGVIPASLLAIVVDLAIWIVEWNLRPTRHTSKTRFLRIFKRGLLTIPVMIAVAAAALLIARPPRADVRIGSKAFGEQLILGEIVAQLIEENTDLTVDRKLGLAGTKVCNMALQKDQIDLYVEYTGTAYRTVLKREDRPENREMLAVLREEYFHRFDVRWLEPLGFENAYTITVRPGDAEENGWEKISDLLGEASGMKAGFTSEFMEREDGYAAVRQTYGIEFADAIDLEPTMMAESLAKGKVDVACPFSTDGRIELYDLKVLEDDENAFPPYEAVPLIRQETLRKHPELEDLLNRLAGRISSDEMRKMNYDVQQNERSPAEVAREFLLREGLIPN